MRIKKHRFDVSSLPPAARLASVRVALVLVLLAGLIFVAGGADFADGARWSWEGAARLAQQVAWRGAAWYRRTLPAERMSWGGLLVCAAYGASIVSGRLLQLRKRLVCPAGFADRLVSRIREGRLDRLKASDLCELNPSAAARVALAAIRRWDRPVAELDRAVALAVRVETDRLNLRVESLRRIAALLALLGLLGTLRLASSAWDPALPSAGRAIGSALGPLTAGVALAILALVAYDGLSAGIESHKSALQSLGADLVDAIELSGLMDDRSRARTDSPALRTPHQPRGTPTGTPASVREPGRELA